jgi:phospholipid transport system substrate-binding protein
MSIRHFRFNSFALLGTLVLLVAGNANALAATPTDSAKVTIDAIMAVIADDSLEVSTKEEKVMTLVNERFDFENMSARVLGPQWRNASDEQKQRFIELFQATLGKTYLVAIEEYSNEAVEFTGEQIKKEKYAQVDTFIVGDRVKTPVNYRMQKEGDDWFVYDVIIEGVSLIRNYRSSYQNIVKKDGVDGLLDQMASKTGA